MGSQDIGRHILAQFLELPVDASLALLFPGQGSQKAGMGKEYAETSALARAVFDAADEALETDLAALCFEGPEEELRRTVNAQPAILATSIASLAAALEGGHLQKRPAYLAGHSLGEYSALVAAGSLRFEEALRLVRERGRLMEEAGVQRPGTMAAVVALDEAAVEQICRESGAEMANYNSPTQFVVGGEKPAVERACALARERGGKGLAVPVSGAFHTSLMAEAAEKFAQAVEAALVDDAAMPIFGNVSARPLQRADEIRDELTRQIISPVRWYQSIHEMNAAGVATYVEAAPGRVLITMLKRSDPQLELVALEGGAVASRV